MEQQNETKKTNKGGAAGFIILRAVLGLLLVVIFAAGSNFLHANSKLLRRTKTQDLNAIIQNGEDLPEGEFVSLKVRFPLGQYAEQSHELTYGGSDSGFTSGMDYYYLIFLEDYTFLSVKVSNNEDIRALDNLYDELNAMESIGSFDDLSNYVELSGKLEKMTDSELISYYKEGVSYLDVDENSEYVRLYELDTTAIPTQNIIILVVCVAAVIGAVYLIFRLQKKKKKEEGMSYVVSGNVQGTPNPAETPTSTQTGSDQAAAPASAETTGTGYESDFVTAERNRESDPLYK